MRNNCNLIGNALIAASFLWSAAAFAQQSHIGSLVGNPKRGKAVYERYCLYCHGAEGDGRGESAPYLNPKPRDFTKAVFKCRSTPSGSLPLDSDLYETITRGIHGSGMPSWKPLLRQERADVVAYIKTFSLEFQEGKPGTAVAIPAEPPASAESIQRGAQLFETMNCWSCHGKDGRGHGPSAATLTDSKGDPIVPFDFTSGSHFKCGDTDREVFRDLVTGLDGTPMPSFASATTDDQRWDLVHYIRSLHTGKKPTIAKNQSGGRQ